MAKKNGLARLRQLLLLVVLLSVALSTWLDRERSTDWNDTLWVAVFPVNGDNSAAAKNYIDALDARDFEPVEAFFEREVQRFGLQLYEPINIDLREPLAEKPPAPPDPDSVLSIMGWSLNMRYWAWRMERSQEAVTPDVKLFMVYYDPQTHDTLPHSVGLQKGLLGVVNAFASNAQRGSNQVVLVHELMHTLGATDKYEPGTALPIHPEGYAEPHASPRYPQRLAEIMGGRIPIDAQRAEIPTSLQKVITGPQTAREIRWTPQ